jgi:hypothetical protein
MPPLRVSRIGFLHANVCGAEGRLHFRVAHV